MKEISLKEAKEVLKQYQGYNALYTSTQDKYVRVSSSKTKYVNVSDYAIILVLSNALIEVHYSDIQKVCMCAWTNKENASLFVMGIHLSKGTMLYVSNEVIA